MDNVQANYKRKIPYVTWYNVINSLCHQLLYLSHQAFCIIMIRQSTSLKNGLMVRWHNNRLTLLLFDSLSSSFFSFVTVTDYVKQGTQIK